MNTSKRYVALRVTFFVLSGIGLVLYIAAFCTLQWSKHNVRDEGLWQIGYDNGGASTFSLWPDHLKTGLLKASQVFAGFGMAFYILFAASSALTIFWTNNWKFARGIKASTVVFSATAALCILLCIILYKVDREPTGSSLSISWFLALVSAILAATAAPFYLIDAIRTVKPKEEKRKMISNIAPVPTMEQMRPQNSLPPSLTSSQKQDVFVHQPGGRPPMLNELRRYRTSFLHPPPKPKTKVMTEKEIDDLPLPPSKTKLNLFEDNEIEGHPSPAPPPPKLPAEMDEVEDTTSTISDSEIVSPDPIQSSKHSDSPNHGTEATESGQTTEDNDHSVFKFHKSKTIQKYGKTFLKIQHDQGEKLPPIMMTMPGNEEEETEEDSERRRKALLSQLEADEEEARRNFEIYFEDSNKKKFVKNDRATPVFKPRRKNKSEKERDKKLAKRQVEITNVYDHELTLPEVDEMELPTESKQSKKKSKRNAAWKDEKKKKQKKKKVTTVDTTDDVYPGSDASLVPGSEESVSENNLAQSDAEAESHVISDDQSGAKASGNNTKTDGNLNEGFIQDTDIGESKA